jgi:NAD(P)H-hydrate epimerase
MMENAGRAVASWLEERGVLGKHVLVLVGPGNNGGDGLVAARYLRQAGSAVSVYCWKRQVEGDENWRLAESAGVTLVQSEEDQRYARLRRLVAEADYVLDSLLGTGVSRPIADTLERLLATVAKGIAKRKSGSSPETFVNLTPATSRQPGSGPLVVAVDVPSGLDCDSGAVNAATLPADVTITLGFPKVGQFLFPGAGTVGELVVADIGIPAKLSADINLEVSTPARIKSLLPQRPLDGHKGTFGKAMVVAGSVNYTGAAYLAASAVLRVGAGLVTLGLAEGLHPILASKLTEATYLLLPNETGALVPQAAAVLQERLAGYDALLLGPGIGREEETVAFVARLLKAPPSEKKPQLGFLRPASVETEEGPSLPPLVVDADGLYALADIPSWFKSVSIPAVLTPHPGEMARLLGTTTAQVQSDRIAIIRRAAQQWNSVVVLKGAYTVIAAPDGWTWLNPFATPALATAGTGDVLAGAITGLLAQGMSPMDAAVVGAYVHGLAGQMVGQELGQAGAVASDLLSRLPLAIRQIAHG